MLSLFLIVCRFLNKGKVTKKIIVILLIMVSVSAFADLDYEFMNGRAWVKLDNMAKKMWILGFIQGSAYIMTYLVAHKVIDLESCTALYDKIMGDFEGVINDVQTIVDAFDIYFRNPGNLDNSAIMVWPTIISLAGALKK